MRGFRLRQNDELLVGEGELEEFAFGEVADEAEVGGEEVVAGEGGEGRPADVVEDAVFEVPGEVVDEEELEVDGASVAIAVAEGGDPGADGGVDAEFFVEFAGEGLLGGFAVFDLASGELPLEAHGLVGFALADEEFGGCGVRAEDEGSHDEAGGPEDQGVGVAVEFADGLFHRLVI